MFWRVYDKSEMTERTLKNQRSVTIRRERLEDPEICPKVLRYRGKSRDLTEVEHLNFQKCSEQVLISFKRKDETSGRRKHDTSAGISRLAAVSRDKKTKQEKFNKEQEKTRKRRNIQQRTRKISKYNKKQKTCNKEQEKKKNRTNNKKNTPKTRKNKKK